MLVVFTPNYGEEAHFWKLRREKEKLKSERQLEDLGRGEPATSCMHY